MKKVTYTEEVIEIIETLPAEYQSEVFKLINSYVLRGCIPTGASPVAEAMFMSLKRIFDKQVRREKEEENFKLTYESIVTKKI